MNIEWKITFFPIGMINLIWIYSQYVLVLVALQVRIERT